MDRNLRGLPKEHLKQLSLSARRAWIEIFKLQRSIDKMSVALRKESVDRNSVECDVSGELLRSLSARRAWIEILLSRHLRSVP